MSFFIVDGGAREEGGKGTSDKRGEKRDGGGGIATGKTGRQTGAI